MSGRRGHRRGEDGVDMEERGGRRMKFGEERTGEERGGWMWEGGGRVEEKRGGWKWHIEESREVVGWTQREAEER